MLTFFPEKKNKETGKKRSEINIYFDRHNNLKRYTNFRLPARETQIFRVFAYFSCRLSLVKWRINSWDASVFFAVARLPSLIKRVVKSYDNIYANF